VDSNLNHLVNVVGWYNSNNIGDESYKLSFPKVFSNYSFRFSHKPIENLKSYILGGGDILSASYIKDFKIFENKSIFSASFSAQQDLSGFKNIFLRDNRSIKLALSLGYNAQYCPDFAFILDYNVENGKALIKKLFKNADLYTKVIVVVVNGYLLPTNRNLTETIDFLKFYADLAKVVDNTSASFIFLPFGYSLPADDRVSNSFIASKCKFHQKNVIIYEEIGVQDTLDIIAASDAVISTRLHSTIFSCVTATPFLDITHNHKNSAFLETNNLEKYSIKYNNFNFDSCIERLHSIINSNNITEELNMFSLQQKQLIKSMTSNLEL
jgi:polysaccharide pyruvyl transferase WcaK-like protein